MSAIVPTTTTVDSETLRRRERLARERRAANVERMEHTREALEGVLVVAQTLGDDEAAWADFLDPDLLRLRKFFVRSLALRKEAAALAVEKVLLQRLLREHEFAMRVIRGMAVTRPTNDWGSKLEQWRRLVKQYYTPRTLDECHAVMEAALKEVQTFQWSQEKFTTGLSLMGWQESRRIDAARGAFQFQFHKSYRGLDMMRAVRIGWDTYTDAEVHKQVIMGPNVRGCHEVLQTLGPELAIIRGVEHFTAIDVDAHFVDLVFRVPTERGFLMCVRSIPCPELLVKINKPSDLWASNSVWLQYDRLQGGGGDDSDRAFKFSIGGTIAGTDVTYLNQWMLEVFGCILRSDRMLLKRQWLTTE